MRRLFYSLNKCAIAFLATIASFCAHAQPASQTHIDSIKKIIHSTPANDHDTTTARLLLSLADAYTYSSADSALAYGSEARALSEKLGWQPGIAAGNYHLGFNYYNRSDYPSALSSLFAALNAYETINDKRGIAATSRKIGNVYRDQKNHAKALEYYLKAQKLFTEQNDQLGLSKCYSNIGEIYEFDNNTILALSYYKQALLIDDRLGYKNGLAINYVRVSRASRRNNALDTALVAALAAVSVVEEHYPGSAIAKEQVQEAYGELGICYVSIALRNKTLNHSTDSSLTKASFFLTKAISLAGEMKQSIDLQTYYRWQADASAISGNYSAAFNNLLVSYNISDSLFSFRNTTQLANVETEREHVLRKRIESLARIKKRNEVAAAITVLAALLAIIVLIARSNRLLAAEKNKSETLLLNILPQEVAQELKTHGRTRVRRFDDVTVLFTDFVNFTIAAEKMPPEELIEELHTCFKAFDEITARHNIEKIKTIGDAYLAVCGLPLPDSDHAIHAVEAAIEITEFMHSRRLAIGSKAFEARVGIHTGSVVAGVVGVRKFVYDIWGDTVNVAARMEQNSEAGKINVSHSTWLLVKDKFQCTFRGEIEAKNKGAMKMYFVHPPHARNRS